MAHEAELTLPGGAPSVTFAGALRFWCRLGFISFGGPAGQIAIMHEELVERRRWISERRFMHALNYCMVLPGPEAQQLATYIGWLLHRTGGGVLAGALFVLPSLFILIALSWVYVAFGSVPVVAGLFYGIKPAVAALVFHAAHRIGKRALKSTALWSIAGAAFVATVALHVPFPLIVSLAAVAGFVGGRLVPSQFSFHTAHGKSSGGHLPALIDDDTPTPAHATFSRARLTRTLLAGVALWAAPVGALVLWKGWAHLLVQMSWFFSKAALLTFGGAYAVLPYVYQGAVGEYHWLTAGQMIDGLGLGETTPGPLIMVVTFVGFVGGYQDAYLGTGAAFLAGALAAVVVTWFTFLPSFIFVLAGGPLVEATHGAVKLTAPLTGITAAVVGVIASLGTFFAYHVLWPGGLQGAFDWKSFLIAVAAAVALVRFKRSVVEVICGCAVAGLVVSVLV